jgi:4,5-dihydroxyphthalate decarboxylase
VVRDELLEEHPSLGGAIFEAFAEAKRLYVDRLRSGKIEKPTAADEVHRRVMEITGGDPLPYGIEPNRRTLEELVSSAVDQGILSRAPKIEDLFARGTRDLVG